MALNERSCHQPQWTAPAATNQQSGTQTKLTASQPGDLRQTLAGDLLDGVDLATVQSLMGHSNANTTARYDRRGERAKRDGVKLLHVPYRKRVRSYCYTAS